MHFAQLVLFAAFAGAVAAQQSTENPFKIDGQIQITAGKPYTIQWTPTTQGPVELRLRQGASSNLKDVATVASSIPNSGSYTFTVPAGTTRNSDYTLAINPVGKQDKANYTPQFVVGSSNTVASQSNSGSTTATATTTTSGQSSSTSSSSSSSSSSTSSSSSSTSSSSSSTSSSSTSSSSTSSSSTSSSSTSSGSSSTSTNPRSSSSSSSRSSSTRSSSSSSTGSSSSAAATTAASAPTSNAAVNNLLNVQGGVAAVMLGAAALL